ncbi:hypothetical protein L7F22_057922 [Adiantum nelumboides]|nr:hypothetical protein [Adiantum nelumboides]
MNPPDEAAAVEKLYEYGQRLAEPSGTKNESDYLGVISAAKGSSKSKQLAAQLIPRFFKHFPSLSSEGINAQLDLCEEDELGIRVQAIRGLPLLCKDTPRHLPKIADVLGQLLLAGKGQIHLLQDKLWGLVNLGRVALGCKVMRRHSEARRE